MGEQILIFFMAGASILVFGMLAMIVSYYKKVPPGKAIIKSGSGGMRVAFDSGIFIIPVIHKMDIMDITTKTLNYSFSGQKILITKDNKSVNLKTIFYVRVNKDIDSVQTVAMSIGAQQASDYKTLENLFIPKFTECVRIVGKKLNQKDIINDQEEFVNKIFHKIGTDLNGFILDDIAIEDLTTNNSGKKEEGNQISGLTLAVTNMKQMLEFYSNVFDINFEEKEIQATKLYNGKMGEFNISLCPTTLAKIEAKQNRHQLDIIVSNLEETIAIAERNGGKIMDKIIEEGSLKSVGIYDPDQNSIVFKELK